MKHAYLIFQVLLTLSMSSYTGFSQTYNFHRPEFNDLLPPKLYCVIQDSKGYYWLGSPEGLSRIEGTTITNYGILDSLASGGVRCIHEDSNGNIWLGHLNGGISRYNGHIFEKASFDSLLIDGDITSITEDNDGQLWFTTYGDGAILVDLPIKDMRHIKAKQYKLKEGLSDQIFGSALLKSGDLIFIADVGLRRFVKNLNQFEKYSLPGLKTFFSSTSIFEDSKGTIWFGTYNGGIYKYISSEDRIEIVDLVKLGLKSNWVTCIMQDSKGRIWIGTWDSGIALFEGDSTRIFNESNGLKAKYIYSITEDVEGNILIVDRMNGLTIFKGDAIISVSEKDILPDPNVNAIYQDKTGAMWFGTNAGISLYSLGSGNPPVFYNKTNNSIFEYIRFFREDKEGNLWIGSNEGGVILYNMKTSKFEAQPYINSKLPRIDKVTSLEIDRENHLWIGTVEGVVKGTINEQNFQRYTIIDSLTVSLITTLYCDPNGDMWIGTEPRGGKPGLIKYNASSEDFSPVTVLPGIIPKTMVMDGNGILSIGTTNAGVFFYDNTEESTGYKLPDVIRSSWISDIKVNSNNDIFIGTRGGLYIYDNRNNRLLFLTKNDGLCDNNINCIYFDNDGFAWIGTSNGASRISTDINQYNKAAPNPIVRNIEINAKLSNPDSLTNLRHNLNNMSFTLGYLGFADPLTISYKVKLEGLDKEWVDYGHNSKIAFPPLAPGKYVLRAMTVSTMGSTSEETLIIPFSITPPWWETYIAYSIYLLLTISSVILFYRFRERKLISEKIVLEKAVRERTVMIDLQNKTLTEQKTEITDSINYAKYIQSAILPQKEILDDFLKEYFILFKPKDIVSGDFYWTSSIENITVVAAVDCTGHGVPGALMSMLGVAFLNEIVNKEYITHPSVILRRMRKEVIRFLHQRGERGEQKDGMDIALCSIDYENMKIQFAGANNPLYLIRNESLINLDIDRKVTGNNHILYEVKGDRMPIGFHDTMDNFALHEIDLMKGDMLYLFTDGYADQFGGPLRKKFQYKNFKKLLLDHCNMPMSEQQYHLDKALKDWQGIYDQIDDILVVGIKVT